MHTLRGLLGRLKRRLRREHGFSLMEPLVAVPLLIAVSTAAASFGLQVMKGQALARNRVTLVENAQRSLDRMVREMRSGSSIEYVAPDVDMQLSAIEGVEVPLLHSGIKSIDNCSSSDPMGYCAGETNRVIARGVVMPAVGTERRDVLYRCDWQAIYIFPYPRCYELFSDQPSGPTLTISDPDMTAATVPPEMTCRLIFPVGGIQGTRTASGLDDCNVVAGGIPAEGNTNNASMFAANDWAWTTPGLGNFRFELDQATSTPKNDYVEIQPTICLRNTWCSIDGYKRPLRLNASVTPRNLDRFQLSDACFNSDPADDPPGGCPS